MKARKQWNDILNVLEKIMMLYLLKLSFTNKGEIKTFSGKQKLKKFVSRTTLQKLLNKFLSH